jgi:hypothetical protein
LDKDQREAVFAATSGREAAAGERLLGGSLGFRQESGFSQLDLSAAACGGISAFLAGCCANAGGAATRELIGPLAGAFAAGSGLPSTSCLSQLELGSLFAGLATVAGGAGVAIADGWRELRDAAGTVPPLRELVTKGAVFG